MQERERTRRLYETAYQVDWRNRDYMWHPRNPIALLHTQVLEWEMVRAFNQLNIELVGQRLLDVGCGYGQKLRFWAELGADPAHLYGFDLAFYRLQHAHSLSPHMGLAAGSASELPYRAKSFDLVSQFSVFSSIHQAELRLQAAREIVRVLRPGGWLVWYDIVKGASQSVQPLSRQAVGELFPDLALRYRRPIFIRPLARLVQIHPLLALLAEYLLPAGHKNALLAVLQRVGPTQETASRSK